MSFDTQTKLAIYQHFAETGQKPPLQVVAERVRTDVSSVRDAYLRLRAQRVLVLELASGAREIAAGNYNHRVELKQEDEIGSLAASFNQMSAGLAERDRVRDLLGKVVSPAIASELLRKKVTLGGEQREVTVLFSDLRNFTRMSEALGPEEMLAILTTISLGWPASWKSTAVSWTNMSVTRSWHYLARRSHPWTMPTARCALH